MSNNMTFVPVFSPPASPGSLAAILKKLDGAIPQNEAQLEAWRRKLRMNNRAGVLHNLTTLCQVSFPRSRHRHGITAFRQMLYIANRCVDLHRGADRRKIIGATSARFRRSLSVLKFDNYCAATRRCIAQLDSLYQSGIAYCFESLLYLDLKMDGWERVGNLDITGRYGNFIHRTLYSLIFYIPFMIHFQRRHIPLAEIQDALGTSHLLTMDDFNRVYQRVMHIDPAPEAGPAPVPVTNLGTAEQTVSAAATPETVSSEESQGRKRSSSAERSPEAIFSPRPAVSRTIITPFTGLDAKCGADKRRRLEGPFQMPQALGQAVECGPAQPQAQSQTFVFRPAFFPNPDEQPEHTWNPTFTPEITPLSSVDAFTEVNTGVVPTGPIGGEIVSTGTIGGDVVPANTIGGDVVPGIVGFEALPDTQSLSIGPAINYDTIPVFLDTSAVQSSPTESSTVFASNGSSSSGIDSNSSGSSASGIGNTAPFNQTWMPSLNDILAPVDMATGSNTGTSVMRSYLPHIDRTFECLFLSDAVRGLRELAAQFEDVQRFSRLLWIGPYHVQLTESYNAVMSRFIAELVQRGTLLHPVDCGHQRIVHLASRSPVTPIGWQTLIIPILPPPDIPRTVIVGRVNPETGESNPFERLDWSTMTGFVLDENMFITPERAITYVCVVIRRQRDLGAAVPGDGVAV